MADVEQIRTLSLESRRSLELPLSMLMRDGRIAIYPEIEAKALLYLQFRKGNVTLTAGKYVGLIPLTSTIAVDVRPKLPVGNFSRVLDKARVSIERIEGVDRLYQVSGTANRSVLEFLLFNLVSSLQPIREHGTLKEYVRKTTVVSHPAGRIKLTNSLQACNARGLRHKVAAERFQQTSDAAANRVLRAGLRHLLAGAIRSRSDRDLIKQANQAYNDFPEEISSCLDADYACCRRLVAARALPSSRSYYYRALEIALLSLANRSVAIDKQGHDLTLDACIIDFETVFEQYLRRILQENAPEGIMIYNGNDEGKKPLFDDRPDPPAQPDIVMFERDNRHRVIIEVKYKEKPDRPDINQAITYGMAYRTDRVVLVHQSSPRTAPGLRLIGTINGIQLYAYAFDLGRADLHMEESAFTSALFPLLSEASQIQNQVPSNWRA